MWNIKNVQTLPLGGDRAHTAELWWNEEGRIRATSFTGNSCGLSTLEGFDNFYVDEPLEAAKALKKFLRALDHGMVHEGPGWKSQRYLITTSEHHVTGNFFQAMKELGLVQVAEFKNNAHASPPNYLFMWDVS